MRRTFSRLHEKVRRIYDLHGASDKLGLLITEGPHKDTQELQVPVFRWFNRFLKMEQPLVEVAAVPLFTAPQLKVFERLPADEITSKCYENFTQLASDSRPLDPTRDIEELKRKTFGGWPQTSVPLNVREVASAEHEGVRLTVHEFESQPGVTLRFYLVRPVAGAVTEVHLLTTDAASWREQMELARAGFSSVLKEELALAGVKTSVPMTAETTEQFQAILRAVRENHTAYITFTPRGVGMTASAGDAKYLVQLRRRFMLLGQTLAGMQTWDVRRAAQAAKSIYSLRALPLQLHASPEMTEVVAFASLFELEISQVTLPREPRVDKEAPDFLNWSRLVTPAQLLALVKGRCSVTVEAQR